MLCVSASRFLLPFHRRPGAATASLLRDQAAHVALLLHAETLLWKRQNLYVYFATKAEERGECEDGQHEISKLRFPQCFEMKS